MDHPRKSLYLPKLFGGPRHGRKYAVDPLNLQQQLHFPVLDSKPRYWEYPDDASLYMEALKTHVYTQRRAVIGDSLLRYYAISTARDDRAFEMLCNHMLRGAIEV